MLFCLFDEYGGSAGAAPEEEVISNVNSEPNYATVAPKRMYY